ncbi:MAG: polysaccharide deacetylase family protein [Candidatus Rokuibacteriota bacterium]
MYHRLTPRTGSHPCSIAVARFRWQLAYLRVLGYRSLPPRMVAEHMRRGTPVPPRRVVITFDDGYLDALTLALPLLREYGFSATCYVVAGAVGQVSGWTAPASLMDWPDLRAWLEGGMEVGSHSLTHPDLTMLGDAALREEVVASRARLEDGLGMPVRSFAYPFNRVDRRALEAVAAAGYDDAVAGAEILRSPYTLVRGDAARGPWWRFGLRLFPAYPAMRGLYRTLVPCRVG